MSMQIESLEVLESAAIAPAQARAIVRAIEIEMGASNATLATKQDLQLHAQLIGDVVRDETSKLRAEIAKSAQELRAEIAQSAKELRAEIAQSAKELRAELDQSVKELRADVTQLRGETHALVGGSVRQMYMALLTQMAVLLGLVYFVATNAR